MGTSWGNLTGVWRAKEAGKGPQNFIFHYFFFHNVKRFFSRLQPNPIGSILQQTSELMMWVGVTTS